MRARADGGFEPWILQSFVAGAECLRREYLCQEKGVRLSGG
ncbi:MAG: hypothetical protein ACJA06_002598 [Halocynthiibacter sp.]|jgi:hypothetical protein